MSTDKKTILLIEDDLITVKMYQAKFESAGLNLLVATSGAQGLEMIKKEKPDLVLLDIKLGDTDGFDILKKVKKDSEIKNIPVILLSNIRKLNGEDKGKKLGAEEFIMKAKILPDELIEKIKKYLL